MTARLVAALGNQSRAEVARAAGLSWPLLDAYLKGSKPGADKLARLAPVLGVSLEWLATGAGSMRPVSPLATVLRDRDRVAIPLYPVELGAGPGRATWPSGEPIGTHEVALASLRGSDLQLSALAGFIVRGRSMEPEIKDGEIAILDLSRSVLPPGRGATYGIRLDDELALKRLRWLDGEIEISSANEAEFPPRRLAPHEAERLQIIGRFWASFDARPRTVQD